MVNFKLKIYKTGVDSSAKHLKQLSEFGVKSLLLPLQGTKEEKDISDYFKIGNTRENFLKLFLELLDTLYSETMAILKSCEIDFNNPPVSAEVLISINDVLNELKGVVNISSMSMSDKERLDLIDGAYSSMVNYRNLVKYYTNKNIGVSYLRAKKKNDTDRVMALYGNPNERY